MASALAQAGQAAAGGGTAEVVLFWIFSVVAIGAALAMVTMRNVVHGALMLVLNFFAIAGMFLVLGSSFLAIVQIIVYAGAIMVLFLFVIMLLGIESDDLLIERDRWARLGAWTLGAALVAAVAFVYVGPFTSSGSVCGATTAAASDVVQCVGMEDALAAADNSSVRLAAESLFTRFLFSFEFVALLLVVATVGALIIGRRDDDIGLRGAVGSDLDAGPAGDVTRLQMSAPHAHGTDGGGT